jgi:hypothetical protein
VDAEDVEGKTLRAVTYIARGNEFDGRPSLRFVVWTLIIITPIKYVNVAMRIDNDGEGGIMALMSLLGVKRGQRPLTRHKRRWRRSRNDGVAIKAFGQNVEEEASDELGSLEGHALVPLGPFSAAAAWGGRVLYAVPNDLNSTKRPAIISPVACGDRWPSHTAAEWFGCHSAASGYSHPLDVLPSCIG